MFSKKNLYLNEITSLAIGIPASLNAKNRLRIRFFLFLAFILLFLPLSAAQSQVTEEWVARYNGPWNHSDGAYALALDSSGNVYVTGPSEGGRPWHDYATVKYDTDGNQIWVARYDGPRSLDDWAEAITVDDSGNVYVTGYSEGSWTEVDFATIKYDPNGNQIWVKRYKGPGYFFGESNAIALDSSGNVYVTGFSEGIGTYEDYATIKYDTDGNQIWVKRYDGPVSFDDIAYDLALDSSGNVYVTGYSHGSEMQFDYATIKYDTNGNQIWVIRYDGPASGSDWAEAIAVDSSGNVYVTGDSEGSGTRFDYATIKYSQSPLPTLSCKTDQEIYNPFEKVQVLADVDNPGLSFSANLLGGVIVIRTPPEKPIILTGEVVKETIEPGLNPDIFLYLSSAILTVIAPKITHGAFCILYTQEDGILAIDTSTWGLEPPLTAQDEFFLNLIRSYIQRYGLENIQNANSDELAAPLSSVPSQTALGNAFPSIANPETWFPFQLSEPGEVTIKIYNASGQLVKRLSLGYKEAGYYLNKEKAAFWNGKNERGERVASGIYFYTMKTGNFTATGKVVILK